MPEMGIVAPKLVKEAKRAEKLDWTVGFSPDYTQVGFTFDIFNKIETENFTVGFFMTTDGAEAFAEGILKTVGVIREMDKAKSGGG